MLDFYNKLIFYFGLINVFLFLWVVFLYKKNRLINFVNLIKTVYKGFEPDTFGGILKGVVWAFIDGVITGVVVAFIIKIIME